MLFIPFTGTSSGLKEDLMWIRPKGGLYILKVVEVTGVWIWVVKDN